MMKKNNRLNQKTIQKVVRETFREEQLPDFADLVVIGGGMAGLCAAIAACREQENYEENYEKNGCRSRRQAGEGESCHVHGTGGQRLSVLILDADREPGRKLLATGNGRCNITNLQQSRENYRTGEELSYGTTVQTRPVAESNGDAKAAATKEYDSLLDGCEEWGNEVLAFLREELHILTHDRNGYVYPRTDQAVTVQKALLQRARQYGITLAPCCRAERVDVISDNASRLASTGITAVSSVDAIENVSIQGPAAGSVISHARFRIQVSDTQNEQACHAVIRAGAVILATGGLVSRAYQCNGDGYAIAGRLGHSAAKPVPALCPLFTEDPHLKRAAGVRTTASVALQIDEKPVASAVGEVQLTTEGISGIPVFQISRYAGNALMNPDKKICSDKKISSENICSKNCKNDLKSQVSLVLDFLPELKKSEWEAIKRERLSFLHISKDAQKYSSEFVPQGKEDGTDGEAILWQRTLQEFCLGLVPEGVASWLISSLGEIPERKLRKLANAEQFLEQLLDTMRSKTVSISGIAGFEKAQVTAGGILLDEMDGNMESRLVEKLFFAGELLDVDGMCGGYNLTWALHSGCLAGKSAMRSLLGAAT